MRYNRRKVTDSRRWKYTESSSFARFSSLVFFLQQVVDASFLYSIGFIGSNELSTSFVSTTDSSLASTLVARVSISEVRDSCTKIKMNVILLIFFLFSFLFVFKSMIHPRRTKLLFIVSSLVPRDAVTHTEI